MQDLVCFVKGRSDRGEVGIIYARLRCVMRQIHYERVYDALTAPSILRNSDMTYGHTDTVSSDAWRTLHRATCDALTAVLAANDVEVSSYHAGKDAQYRRRVLEDWWVSVAREVCCWTTDSEALRGAHLCQQQTQPCTVLAHHISCGDC